MKTVLIVEDEKLIRQGLHKMIQRSGVPVEVIMECNNGETALEILKEQSIDVMFTDIRMPKMDGIELVERMQECEHIPLTVAISGYDDFNYAVAMMHNGVREYLLKPISNVDLETALRRIVGIVQANKANKYYAEGIRVAGDSANSTAKTMTIIGFIVAGLGLAWTIWLFSQGNMSALMEAMERLN